MNTLPGDYIAGFVDGEGCFALKYRLDRKVNKKTGKIREYFYWNVEFAVVLKPDDTNILEMIKNTLGCGSITYTKDKKQVRYSIQSPKLLKEIIVPFFNKFSLRPHEQFPTSEWANFGFGRSGGIRR